VREVNARVGEINQVATQRMWAKGRGMIIGIYGKSGTGKTTLAKHLSSMVGDAITVIDGVKTKHEADTIKSCGGLLIKLEPYVGWCNVNTRSDMDDYHDFDATFWPSLGGMMEVASIIKEKLDG
jgi:ABC-type multidrug transport system ATPase subunit